MQDVANCFGIRWHGAHKVQACRCTFLFQRSIRKSYRKASRKVSKPSSVLLCTPWFGNVCSTNGRSSNGKVYKKGLISQNICAYHVQLWTWAWWRLWASATTRQLSCSNSTASWMSGGYQLPATRCAVAGMLLGPLMKGSQKIHGTHRSMH